MELTKEQVLQIDNYISACGIKYYDVKMEIVDHFASILELRLEEEPDLDFKKAIVEEHKKFSNNGFKKLLETKTKSTHNRFIKQTLLSLKSFFRLPKIIISIALFFVLHQIMDVVENKEYFFSGLVVFGFLLFVQLGIRVFLDNRKKNEKFLSLERTQVFLMIVNQMVVWFQIVSSTRYEKSYLNNDFNLIHLAVFVLMLLIYWSMEHVYYQNKKQVQEQYPNVIV